MLVVFEVIVDTWEQSFLICDTVACRKLRQSPFRKDICNYISREAEPRRNAYWSHASVCLSVPRRIPISTLLHGPGCNLGNSMRCPPVVHYWTDLQSCTGFVVSDNVAGTRNVSECLYLLDAWFILFFIRCSLVYSFSTWQTQTPV